ncbi:YicC/YloC family endoribonuclease [Desulforudis sp. 1088]|uniref:YicC/YloC family endoribonuclease n=1 Tax=unclassified Candidatus Desulforudis TaxID=2635950 RepID=UPI00347FF912
MLRSMTGYGRGEAVGARWRFSVEIRAVNHRFSEVVVRLPRTMLSLEDRVRRLVQAAVSRGRADVFITVEETAAQETAVKVDKGLALAYYKAMKELQADLGLDGAISLDLFVNLPEVFAVEQEQVDPEEWWSLLEQAVLEACQSLVAMREQEGATLVADLKDRLRHMLKLREAIQERVPALMEAYRQRLETRMREMLDNVAIDPQRLAQEVAIFAERSDISEELVRLESHLKQALDCLEASGPMGRRLDFLAQEMFREVNTIGSKGQDEGIAGLVVDLKTELEKVREQVQNIE